MPILLFALGVFFLQTRAALPGIPGLWGGALCLALPSLISRHRLLRGGLWAACFLLGVAWAAWRADLRLADELGRDWEGRDVAVIGTVATLPQAFERGQRFEFVVERVLSAGAVVPTSLQLARYRGDDKAAPALPELRPGQRWQWSVRLKRPHGGANPGGFDYEAYLLERGIRATGYVRPGAASLLDEFVWRPEHVVERLRFAVRASFLRMLPGDDWPWLGILVALAVGDQKGVQGGCLKILPALVVVPNSLNSNEFDC